MPALAVSLDEYLSTTYEPDREYVNGQLVEREGTQLHSILQTIIAAYMRQIGSQFRFKALNQPPRRMPSCPTFDVSVKRS
jgi:hypothetical protein